MDSQFQEIDSARVHRAASELVEVALGTARGQEGWSPVPNGRGVIDHLVNCAVANRRWAAIIRDHTSTTLAGDAIENTILCCGNTVQAAADELMRSAAELAVAIRDTADDHLDLVISVPWWPEGKTMSLGSAFLEAAGNMAFCAGQIWTLQLMAGTRPTDPPIAAGRRTDQP